MKFIYISSTPYKIKPKTLFFLVLVFLIVVTFISPIFIITIIIAPCFQVYLVFLPVVTCITSLSSHNECECDSEARTLLKGGGSVGPSLLLLFLDSSDVYSANQTDVNKNQF